ncbi:ribosome maturation factor RimP [Henriciella marina]|uniref:ribosome maturation factor RimP n=1 Tax=Henriciella marina TaxID=453851 RepID=UPI00035CC555|nr:ribosome maturation factor RimP [Henriciella marina]
MIALSQQEKTILALIDPVAEGLGMEIVRVRLMGGNRPILQIMAEKAGGAPTDVEDCANLSHGISPVLEAADPISDPFRLEVSTPGIDRPLTRKGDFGRWAGHLAKVELAMPISGRRRFQGIIQREDDRGVAIELDDESELVAQVEDMSKASLILTDELIDAAQKAGGLPPQPDDEDFSGLDVDDSEDDDSEDNKEENGATR